MVLSIPVPKTNQSVYVDFASRTVNEHAGATKLVVDAPYHIGSRDLSASSTTSFENYGHMAVSYHIPVADEPVVYSRIPISQTHQSMREQCTPDGYYLRPMTLYNNLLVKDARYGALKKAEAGVPLTEEDATSKGKRQDDSAGAANDAGSFSITMSSAKNSNASLHASNNPALSQEMRQAMRITKGILDLKSSGFGGSSESAFGTRVQSSGFGGSSRSEVDPQISESSSELTFDDQTTVGLSVIGSRADTGLSDERSEVSDDRSELSKGSILSELSVESAMDAINENTESFNFTTQSIQDAFKTAYGLLPRYNEWESGVYSEPRRPGDENKKMKPANPEALEKNQQESMRRYMDTRDKPITSKLELFEKLWVTFKFAYDSVAWTATNSSAQSVFEKLRRSEFESRLRGRESLAEAAVRLNVPTGIKDVASKLDDAIAGNGNPAKSITDAMTSIKYINDVLKQTKQTGRVPVDPRAARVNRPQTTPLEAISEDEKYSDVTYSSSSNVTQHYPPDTAMRSVEDTRREKQTVHGLGPEDRADVQVTKKVSDPSILGKRKSESSTSVQKVDDERIQGRALKIDNISMVQNSISLILQQWLQSDKKQKVKLWTQAVAVLMGENWPKAKKTISKKSSKTARAALSSKNSEFYDILLPAVISELMAARERIALPMDEDQAEELLQRVQAAPSTQSDYGDPEYAEAIIIHAKDLASAVFDRTTPDIMDIKN